MNPAEKITYVWELLCDSMKDQPQSERIVHLSWLLLLKYLDYYEASAEALAEQKGEQYIPIIEKGCRWSDWVPRALNSSPSVSEDEVLHGDQLIEFLRSALFPYLGNRWTLYDQLPLQKTLAAIFREPTVPICTSANVLRTILEAVDSIDFHQPDVLSTIKPIYEGLLQQMTIDDTLARDFITPRSLIRSVIEVVNPQPGEKVYDPACGMGGFLIEAYKHMQAQPTSNMQGWQGEIYGNALDKISALLCATRMSLAEVPMEQIHHGDTLLEDHIRFDKHSRLIILSNPPFGFISDEEIKQNNSLETAHNIPLFLNHHMDIQAESGGRTGIIVPRKALDMDPLAFVETRARLLKEFNLLMVVNLPSGTFKNTQAEASILFFEAGGPTRETFYYDVDLLMEDSRLQQAHSEEPFTLVRKAWEEWREYIRGSGSRPERTKAIWIEVFDNKKFGANKYKLGMERPSTFKYTRQPPPLELTDLLLAICQRFDQAANIQKPLVELTHHVLQSNQQFQQRIRNIKEKLAKEK